MVSIRKEPRLIIPRNMDEFKSVMTGGVIRGIIVDQSKKHKSYGFSRIDNESGVFYQQVTYPTPSDSLTCFSYSDSELGFDENGIRFDRTKLRNMKVIYFASSQSPFKVGTLDSFGLWEKPEEHDFHELEVKA